ncbi:hypothetical protein [Methylobacterium sp. R2-1]|uniref:hypothetical protein n=1 Tax=Methylobacterium sp. R2-1 TaxID=2587064 RepID=UPI00160E95F2|nr:hypothetical protein [Methylobacterium sp. R2-1]MBB2962901.1 hypothetical protein [Methylobacterium sp. R2-1]
MRPLIIDSFAGKLSLGELSGLRRDPILAQASSIDSSAIYRKSADDTGQIKIVPGRKSLFGYITRLMLRPGRHSVVLRRATQNILTPNQTNSIKDVRLQNAPVLAGYRTNIDSFAEAASSLGRVTSLLLGNFVRTILCVGGLFMSLRPLITGKWNGSWVRRSVLDYSEIVGSVRRVGHGVPPLGQLGRTRGVARREQHWMKAFNATSTSAPSRKGEGA